MVFKMVKMSELPFELVIEILARVPVKELVRFRCVCKSWRSLFQEERFIRKHANHAQRMILYVCSRQDPPSTCSYEGRRLEMISREAELSNGGEKRLLLKTVFLGHCDGLFCLQLRDRSLAVWNPSLRELRKVSTIKRHHTKCMIGFGYDHSIQDHKMVVITPLETNSSKALVLRLKSSVSRTIDIPWTKTLDWLPIKKEGILVGENIFWQIFTCKTAIELRKSILVFSLVSETFNYCSGPDRIPGKQVYRNLKVLRGSLCAVERERGDFCDDMVIWCADHEKEDKGRIKSWSKISRLTAFDIERSTCWRIYEFRLGTVLTHAAGLLLVSVRTRDGEIKLCEYNLEEDRVRKVDASLPISLCYYSRVFEEYIATLVPTGAF